MTGTTTSEASREGRLSAAAPELLAALKMTQFGFNLARCPVCAGYESGQGERDRHHNESCPVSAAIAKAEGR